MKQRDAREQTDIQLMLSVRESDPAAFQELARRYREPLRRFFRSVLADSTEVDDCIQETLLRLWLNRERYEPVGRFSTYLFQIGKYHALNQRRKFRPAPESLILDGLLALEAEQPESVVFRHYRDGQVRRAVAALDSIYRSVFELVELEGLRYAEAASRLGIPSGTVKSRMAEAVRRLRSALTAEDGALPEDPGKAEKR